MPKMDFYYCQSLWEHAVIEAKSATHARKRFMEIINRNLEPHRHLTISGVTAQIINLYLMEKKDEKGNFLDFSSSNAGRL